MKTRQSLVSNSSTTSFCIYGIELDGLRSNSRLMFGTIKKYQKKFVEEYTDFINKKIEYYKKQVEKDKSDYIVQNLKLYEFFKNDLTNKSYDDYCVIVSHEEDEYDENLYGIFDELLGKLGFSTYSNYDADCMWIGRSFKSIHDNETGLQFKEQIANKIAKLFEESKCFAYEEAWNS